MSWKTVKPLSDFQLCEPAVKLAQNAGVVAGNIQHFIPLQIQVLIQGLDEHLPGRDQDTEDPSLRVIVGYSSKSIYASIPLRI